MELKSKRFKVVPAKRLKMVMGIAGGQTVKYVSLLAFQRKETVFRDWAQFYDARILFFPVHSMIGQYG